MNVNFSEGIQPERTIDTLAKSFSQELRTGIRPETNFISGSNYKLFAEQAAVMQQESIDGVPMIPQVDNLGDFSNELVTSVLDSRPDETRMLVYAEKGLIENGNSQKEIALAIGEAVNNLPPERCAENMKDELRNHLYYLRGQFKREFGGKINIKTENIPKAEEAKDWTSNYVYTKDFGLEKGRSGIVDYAVDPINGVEAYCGSSFETIEGLGNLDSGEDATGFYKVDNKVVLVEADGVSQSFMGSYASREAVDEIVKNGGSDLVENVRMAGKKLVEVHDSLPIPNDVAPGLKNVLERKKKEVGSQTMLNQLSIDLTTGKVDGCFMGDGGFTVLRKDGSRQDYECAVDSNFKGDSNIRLATVRGLMGLPVKLEAVGAGDLVLDSGEAILLYSDGMTKNMINRIEEIYRNGGDFKKEIPKLIESLKNSQEKDDDRSLLVFTRK